MTSAGTVTPAIKLQQWKRWMRQKGDASTTDHCDECNNGIHETKVATIACRKPVVPDATYSQERNRYEIAL